MKTKAGDENRVSTDAILAIKPEFTKLIVARKKNHEFRNYKLETVTRFWLYETAPTSAITYVCYHPSFLPQRMHSTGMGTV